MLSQAYLNKLASKVMGPSLNSHYVDNTSVSLLVILVTTYSALIL